MAQRAPVCWITGFGNDSVDYVLRFWIGDAEGGLTNVRGQVYPALLDAFKKHGVAIPFPQREVRVVNGAIAIMQDVPEKNGRVSDGLMRRITFNDLRCLRCFAGAQIA